MHFDQPLHYIAELTNRKETEHLPFIFFYIFIQLQSMNITNKQSQFTMQSGPT